MWRRRLPSRGQWELSHTNGETGAHRRHVLRYTARDLETKRIDPGQFKMGRLVLMLLLNEVLAPDEELEAFARVRDDVHPRWMVLTSARVLFMPDSPITFDGGEITAYAIDEITVRKCRRRLLRSRLHLVLPDKKLHLVVRGKASAAKLGQQISSIQQR